MRYEEIQGDLIKLAKEGKFDVIAHGCNCHCTMGAGIAPQMAEAFGCDDFPKERVFEPMDLAENVATETGNKGDINKLGTIDYQTVYYSQKLGHRIGGFTLPRPDSIIDIIVVNAYTQYNYGRNHADGDLRPIDYEALTLCMRKMNKVFAGKHIGLPQIGSGLAGGNWNRIKSIIQSELIDCKVTVVIYNRLA